MATHDETKTKNQSSEFVSEWPITWERHSLFLSFIKMSHTHTYILITKMSTFGDQDLQIAATSCAATSMNSPFHLCLRRQYFAMNPSPISCRFGVSSLLPLRLPGFVTKTLKFVHTHTHSFASVYRFGNNILKLLHAGGHCAEWLFDFYRLICALI